MTQNTDYTLTHISLGEQARRGWICPKCDVAISPDERKCPDCSQGLASAGIIGPAVSIGGECSPGVLGLGDNEGARVI